MNKITGRDVELLVAGALAFWGFQELVDIPFYFISGLYSFWWFTMPMKVLEASALLPGIAIFAGKKWGISAAQIYLWFWVALCVLAIGGSAIVTNSNTFHDNASAGKVLRTSLSIGSSNLIVCTALLWLLYWSRKLGKAEEPLVG
jgi:hypothetical protein